MTSVLIRRLPPWRFVPVARCQVTVLSRPDPLRAVVTVDSTDKPRLGDLVVFDGACWRLDGGSEAGWRVRRVRARYLKTHLPWVRSMLGNHPDNQPPAS